MQKDAIDRLGLTQLLLEPELLDAVEPDVHLVGTLLSLNRVMPETSKATARMVVEKVVREVEERIAQKTRTAVTGALNRSARITNPSTATSTGIAPSAPTSRTTCPNTRRWCRSDCSDTAADRRPCTAT